jgi:N-acetylneuraminic acid mutarotase
MKPLPRHGHTMTPLHQYFVVFGGNGDEGNYFNDFFIFNTNENEW